ncbi:hypothetical protein LCGC14_3079130 [marine sediment metagenome]|uniref:DUF2283 domain-containing protein n=1 Tax=marine sediment metagenome TaxID=412755 RepID=A0A0F8Z4K7_9ZZZZ
MKVTYDKRARAIYIQVSDVPSSFGIIDHTEELVADTVLIDYLLSGEVYGIDVSGIDCIEDITDVPTG